MKRKALIWICAVGCIVAVSGYVSWIVYWGVPGRIDFLRHHSRYEAIVKAMRARPPIAEGTTDFVRFGPIDAFAAPDEAGHLTITLVTADWGHLGKAGYLFTEAEPVPVEGDPYCDVDAPGDLWKLGAHVAPHWWLLSNNLQ
jgi:hypothetical protein